MPLSLPNTDEGGEDDADVAMLGMPERDDELTVLSSAGSSGSPSLNMLVKSMRDAMVSAK
jgi:hypothetical protein